MKLPALKSSTLRKLLPGLYVATLLAFTWMVYSPGFSGSFLFDDFSSLSQLGNYGTIDNPESLWLYLLGNFSGPTGRPVSMLSFLLDARDWPTDPEPFKRTNILIHLLNSLVLFALIRKLTLALKHDFTTATSVALLATALWLLHPLWVSTTLYAVQRMAQLSTLFTLLGLWLYTSTRLKYPPTLTIKMLIGTGLAVGLMGMLAVLSKENGALLPLLVITVEMTVLKVNDQNNGLIGSRWFRHWRLLLLGLPTLLLIGYLAMQLRPLLEGNPGIRNFTPLERLLTQGRILWEYLFHLILPRPNTGGLFNDDIIVSTSLFHPWYTIVAWGTWLAIMIWALFNRTKHPAMALAILFFLCGHLLESSFIQLELYFEHRNYLPAALLGFPVALWWITRPIKGLAQYLPPLGILMVFALITGIRANLWGQPFLQAISWAQINPESPRTQIYLADKWRQTNNLKEAERLNAKAITLSPHDIPTLGQKVGLDCQLNNDTDQSIRTMIEALAKKTEISAVDRHHLAKLLDFLISKSCGNSSNPENILAIIRTIQDSNHGQNSKSLAALLAQRMGIVMLQQGKPREALEEFYHSTNLTPIPGMVLKNAALLATYAAYEEALEYLETADLQENIPHSWSIIRLRQLYTANSGYYQREKSHLREQITKDALILSQQQPASKAKK